MFLRMHDFFQNSKKYLELVHCYTCTLISIPFKLVIILRLMLLNVTAIILFATINNYKPSSCELILGVSRQQFHAWKHMNGSFTFKKRCANYKSRQQKRVLFKTYKF